MILLKNGNSESRLGISCSKKIGNSVVRHTMARKLREIFRLHKDELAVGVDIVVVVRNGARGISYQELEKSFLSLCRRHHIAETKSGG